MNPAVFQYGVDYSVTDEKYVTNDRSYSNALPSHGYLDRRANSTNAPLNTSSTSGSLEYHGIHVDTPFSNNSQLILSPPVPIDAVDAASIPSSNFTFAEHSRLPSSNASSAEQYTSGTSSFLHTVWNGSNMTEIGPRSRTSSMHNSPHNVFPTSVNLTNPYPPRIPVMDSYNYNLQHDFSVPNTVCDRQRRPLHPPFHGVYAAPVAPMPPQNQNRVEGPPFEETKNIIPLTNGKGQIIYPEILASIPKGFFQVDNKWTCYRRNYFTVTCAFTFQSRTPDAQLYLQRHSHLEPVHQYAVSISAHTSPANNAESEPRGLVQHTPKRDKATESIPGRHLVTPSPYPNIAATFFPHNGATGYAVPLFDTFGGHNHQATPTSYSFERIQFQKATANNGKRRAQQQYFHVVVELQINIRSPGGTEEWLTVATKSSTPMVVRGRSPGHYKDNRRDSQNIADPDVASTSMEGVRHGAFSIPPIGGGSHSSMDWIPPHQRHSHDYGHSYTRSNGESDESSFSTESSTMTSSPTDHQFTIHDVPVMKTFNQIGSVKTTLPTFSNASAAPNTITREPRLKRILENETSLDYTERLAICPSQRYSSPAFGFSPSTEPFHH